MEVVDSFTVKFRFRPHADVLESWRTLAVLPYHLLGNTPTEELVSHPYGAVCPIGNGPFRFVSHLPGGAWTFESNPAFPDALGGRPYLDRYVYRVIPTHTTLLAELMTEGVDVYVQMLPNHAATAREEPGLRVWSFPYPSIFFVAWNGRVPELSDARVRRALTLGTNRRQIIEGVREFLDMLMAGSVPIAICSGALRSEIELILQDAGLRSLFDVIVSAEEVTRGKPDPEGFLQCNGNPIENQIIVILGPVVLDIGTGVVIVGNTRICVCFIYLVFYRGGSAVPL